MKGVPFTRKGIAFSNAVVIKVGGSCLENGSAIKTVIGKIRGVIERGLMPVIVVSALKGMTDSLLDVATNAHNLRDPKTIDRILAEGEQLSARLLQSALQNAGLKAEAILISDPRFPIITDEEHGDANAILEETEPRVRSALIPLLENKIIPVVPGFVGKTKSGEITTMGRGSSDTTAIILGKALMVKEVILLKDVPGILSADSKLLGEPKKLHRISVEQALDLGTKGGKVLCPVSLKYKPKEVTVRIVNFDNGDILKGGTEIIGELADRMKVSNNGEGKAAVTVIGNNMSEVPGLLARFSTALAKEGVNIFSVSSSKCSICFYVGMKQQNIALRVLHDLVKADENLIAVTSTSNISMITIAGKDFATRPGVLGKIGNALAERAINILDISTSVCEADIFVASKDAEKAREVLEGLL